MAVAAKLAELAETYRPDAIFVDGGGPGGGVVDRVRQLGFRVIEVQFGGKADRAAPGEQEAFCYANKRAEMWGSLRQWLPGGMIPDSRELLNDLVGVQYGYAIRDGRDAIILERKEDMRKRGLASPDHADALALTFAYPVSQSDRTASLAGVTGSRHEFEYNPAAHHYAPVNQPRREDWTRRYREQPEQHETSYNPMQRAWLPFKR
jgi:hypothetical protein